MPSKLFGRPRRLAGPAGQTMRPTRHASRATRARIGAIVLGLCLGVGIAWTALNLSDFPHYGDTIEYVHLARVMRVDEHRGIGYPWLLALASRWCMGEELPQRLRWEKREMPRLPCSVPAGLTCLQLLQILVSIVCIAYFLYVMLARANLGADGSTRADKIRFAAVLALVVFDPLINHFNLSLVTDSLTFSASLAFCAALADLAFRRTRPWAAGAMLFATFMLASGLRVEKRWILLMTFAATILFWTLLKRRAHVPLSPGWSRRSAAALALIGFGLILTIGIHRAVYQKSAGTSLEAGIRSLHGPLLDTVVHYRLIFPHLSGVYDDLPERAKALISREAASFYDKNANNPSEVMFLVAGGDDRKRRELTHDLVKTVVPRRWNLIALDIARDVAENLLSTASFYLRIAVWRIWGDEAIQSWFPSDAAVWDYQRLTFHHPRMSTVYIFIFVVILAFSTSIALRQAYFYFRRESRGETARKIAIWIPVLVLWVLNAFSFAVFLNITNVRYMILSHALILVLIYNATIRWLLSHNPRAPA